MLLYFHAPFKTEEYLNLEQFEGCLVTGHRQSSLIKPPCMIRIRLKICVINSSLIKLLKAYFPTCNFYFHSFMIKYIKPESECLGAWGNSHYCFMRTCHSSDLTISFCYVNSGDRAQKTVAGQAAEFPGFYVTLEISSGTPTSIWGKADYVHFT